MYTLHTFNSNPKQQGKSCMNKNVSGQMCVLLKVKPKQ